MSSRTGAIRAGRAFVELYADDSKLKRVLATSLARMKAFGSQVKAIGRQMVTAGAVGALPFAISAKTFAEFESTMSRVKALTGATGKDFQALEAKAKKLGEETVFSASQAAEAMSYFALAGFNTEKILTAIGPTLNMAAAGQIGIAEAADIAAKIMAGMGIEAENLGEVVDVMTKAFTTSNTDLLMLGEAFKFVGPMAKTAGISLEEITASIQLLSNAGIQGEMAGTTLRGMILALTSPSSEAAAELERLGVKAVDSAGNVRSLAAIIGDLERATSGMGSGEKLASLGTIFPARQAAGAAELISQGAATLMQATAALDNAAGTAARISGTQLDNVKGDWVIFTSMLEGVQIAAGDTLKVLLRLSLQGLTGLLGKLAEWIKQNPALVAGIAAGTVALIASGAALMAFGGAVSAVGFIVSSVATVVGGLVSAVTFLLTPAGALVAILAAIGYAAGKALLSLVNWTQVIGVGNQAWKAMVAAMESGDLERAGKIAFAALELAWLEMITGIKTKWSEVKQSISEAVSAAKELATFGAGDSVADEIRRHQADRKAMRDELLTAQAKFRELVKVNVQPAAESTGPQAVANTTIPTSTIESLDATARQKISGTISGLSERMFDSKADGTWKRLDQIAANTARTADAIKNLRLGMVYTR